jgi:hypothetical protein
MANGETGKTNVAERSLRFLRNVHIGIGATALAGAVIFPQAAIFSAVAGYEGLNAAAHEGLRQAVKPRPKRNPQPA